MEGKGLESRTAFLLLFPSCSLCPWRSDSPRLQRYRTHGLIPPEFNASPADKLRLAQHQWQGGQCRRPPTTVARRHALLTPWSWDSSPPLMGVPVGSPEGIPPWQSSLPPWARDSFSHLDPPMALAGESALLGAQEPQYHQRKWIKTASGGTCLMVHWLKLHTSTAEGMGLRPGWRN